MRRLLEIERSVTLTGSGGVGKSRLAGEIVEDQRNDSGRSVCWVEFGPDAGGEAVADRLADVVLAEPPSRDPVAAVVEQLADRTCLLVLDGCEHVAPDVKGIADRLRRTCPGITLLATSRVPLGSSGEVVWRVPPLSFAAEPRAVPPSGVLAQDAVALFIDRAMHANPQFSLDASAVYEIADLCARLDGIPLAIELAAAHCGSMSTEELLALLGDALSIAARHPAGRPPHHRTIEASISWSHDHIDEDAQAVLRRLSVFAGGFDLDDALAVVGGETAGLDSPLEPPDVIAALERLAAHTLVEAEGPSADRRFRLLDVIRQYAWRELVDAGEAVVVVQRHIDRYLTSVLGLEDRFLGRDAFAALTHEPLAEQEVRLALDRAAEAGEWERFGRAVWLLSLEWPSRGKARECLAWQDRYLQAQEGMNTTTARIVYVRGATLLREGRLPDAADELARAEHLGLAAGDDLVAGRAASDLGFLLSLVDPPAAADLLPQAVGRLERAEDPAGVVRAHVFNAFALAGLARYGQADESLGTATRLLGTASMPGLQTWTHLTGATCAVLRGDTARALDLVEVAEATGGHLRVAELRLMNAFARSTALLLQDDPDPRLDELEQEIETMRRTGYGFGPLLLALPRALALHANGRPDAALTSLDELTGRASAWGASYLTAQSRLGAADAAHAIGDIATVEHQLVAAADTLASLGNPQLEARSWRRRAALQLARNEPGSSARLVRRALQASIRCGDRLGTIQGLELSAITAARRRAWRQATRSTLLAERLRQIWQVRLRLEPERSSLLSAGTEARARVASEEIARMEAEIVRQEPEDILAALTQARHHRAVSGWASLTPAERRVAARVAEGLSNPAIASHLGVSRETVKTHVSNVLSKLSMTSRAQIAAEASWRSGRQ